MTRVGIWLPGESSFSSQVTKSSEFRVVNAGEARIAGTAFDSQVSPWATVPSCMSWSMFGVIQPKLGVVSVAARSVASWV